MAGRRLDPFIKAVISFAQRDESPTKAAVDGRLQKREFVDYIFFHDSNGMPVIFDKCGSHDRIRRNMTCFSEGKRVEDPTQETVFDKVLCNASQGEDLYRGRMVVSFLDNLLLADSRLIETLRGEIAKAEGRAS